MLCLAIFDLKVFLLIPRTLAAFIWLPLKNLSVLIIKGFSIS